ncbi:MULTISPECIES: hypothetical protein [unclassified Sinorhizobium]|uniref:hypothetical protein n=1 Tax=unclassified Sinorhizobium TaxID=2613772 RepID=UPI0035233891
MANLAVLALSPLPYAGVAVSVANGKASRYDRPDFNVPTLRTYIGHMEQLGALSTLPAIFRQQRTIIAPTPMFTDMLQRHGVTADDFGRAIGRETVELWSKRTRIRERLDGTEIEEQTRGKELVDYQDTEETLRLRREMEIINRVLSNADLRLDGKRMPAAHMVRKFRIEHPTDPHAFSRHGRLYGGWWQDLSREYRHLLTINGEPACDLDYSSAFVRLGYLRQGIEPPPGDLYAIPGLEGHRDAVKELMVSLFFRQSAAKKLPRGIAERLPSGWTMQRFKAAAVALHPELAPLFDTDVGFELMHAESRMLVAVLLQLAGRGIVALGMHDGIMVAQSAREGAIAAMVETSRAQLGHSLPVVEKAIIRPMAAIPSAMDL